MKMQHLENMRALMSKPWHLLNGTELLIANAVRLSLLAFMLHILLTGCEWIASWAALTAD